MYDILFSDDTAMNDCGFKMTLEEAKDYIATWNGTNHGYFEDYKGGFVCIICCLSDAFVYEEEVR